MSFPFRALCTRDHRLVTMTLLADLVLMGQVYCNITRVMSLHFLSRALLLAMAVIISVDMLNASRVFTCENMNYATI